MNKLFIFFMGLLSLAEAHSAIYGRDDRRDINQMPSLRTEAQAVAIAVPKNFTAPKGNDFFEMQDVELLSDPSTINACLDERFSQQPIIGNCTGFWIGSKYLVTAGHCILPNGVVDNSPHPFCESFHWYFDYNLDEEGKTHETHIPESKLYSCTRIIRAENVELGGRPGTNFGNDFALIELDREVKGSMKPLRLQGRRVKKGEKVFTIGHPSGLPAKYSGLSRVLQTRNSHYFEVNLDTLGGNSGSPVFNLQKEVIGILVSGHPVDYYEDGPCQRVNRCNETGRRCKKNSRFGYLQVSNFVQYIDALEPFLP